MRLLEQQVQLRWDSGKALIVTGPRQVGKTTLVEKLCRQHGPYLLLNAGEPDVRQQSENVDLNRLKQIIGQNEAVFVDETQRIRKIGLTPGICGREE